MRLITSQWNICQYSARGGGAIAYIIAYHLKTKGKMRSSVIKAFLAASGFALVAYSCESVDQPNPIAQDFPQEATGTLNGTMAVIPVPLKKIRKVIPSQWGILEHAYRDLLPHFPKNSYPLIMQGLHDHDIQVYAADFHLDDFSVRAPSLSSVPVAEHGRPYRTAS